MSLARVRKSRRKMMEPLPTRDEAFGKVVPMLREFTNNKPVELPLPRIGSFKTDISVYETPPASGLRVTWLGYSGLLIEIDGKRILVDPVLTHGESLLPFTGRKASFKPPLMVEELPPLDAVVISQANRDHLDKVTLKFFAGKNIPFFCPAGVGRQLVKSGIIANFISEMEWGDSMMIGLECVVTATPAQQTGRGINLFGGKALWSSFVIKGPKHRLFYCPGPGHPDDFEEIGDTFGPFDIAMLEAGGAKGADANSTTDAHLALKGKMLMPIHPAAFNNDPVITRTSAEKCADSKHVRLFTPQFGEPAEV